MSAYSVDPDITVASTIDSAFYLDEATYALAGERIFARTWQWIGDLADVAESGSLSPRELLPGILDEPLLLSRDRTGTLRCLSNVCTHRGNILVHAPCAQVEQIRCGYHSRRFDLSGRMTFMPEFVDAKNFPSASDNLPQVPFATWANHGFAALDPAAPLEAFIGDIIGRLPALPVERFRLDPTLSRDYVVKAHWALYVENYLEGFHIPFVHAADLERDGAPAAQYWWIFPNLMLNFYPWGLSLNRVVPQGIDSTRIEFRAYVEDEAKLGQGAGGALDEVELEDEAIVEAVQRGVRSRFYRQGRYSPTRERGTHHFHRLLCRFMQTPVRQRP